jgi:short-subunit dehydrogenase
MGERVIVVTGASSGIGAAVAQLVAERGHAVVLTARREAPLAAVAALCQLTDDDIDGIMRVNVKSALYGMQETLPYFKSRGDGHVINVSSMLGRIPNAMMRSAYCAAKHFLNAMTAMFREEVQQTHPSIQISLVSPGIVHTNFGLNALHGGPDSRQLPGAQSPEEVAQVIMGVIDSRAPDVYTRLGARERVAAYYSTIGVDPS